MKEKRLGEPAVDCRQAFRGSGFRLRCLLRFRHWERLTNSRGEFAKALLKSGFPLFLGVDFCARKAQPSQTTLRATTILLAFALLFASCSRKTTVPEAKPAVSDESTENLDIDLSKMNANMVYAQVFDMMIDSEAYAEKRIKMSGAFEIYPASDNGKKAYAIIISDALACCRQGIEFQYDFENQEPQAGAELTVTGTFKLTELENGIQYFFVEAEKVEK